MKNRFKKLVAAVAALAVAFTAVAVTNVTTAKAADSKYESIYTSEGEYFTANVEKKYAFTVDKSADIDILVMTATATDATLTLYNSAGNVVTTYDNNPLTVSSTVWVYDDTLKAYLYDDLYESLPAGDYFYGVKFTGDNYCMVDIAKKAAAAKINQTKATITVGYTQKLSVEGAKVTKWSSSKKDVATVDSKGKVTAKKTGKTTISAKLDNGQTVKCTVTVKANKYSASKPAVSDVVRGDCVMSAYSASFDSKGNLVIKARFVNNYYYKVTALNNIKITVKDSNGKVVGTYSAKKKSTSIAPANTKDFSFTISKSSLKQKKADLRNATITCDGKYTYVW